MTYHPIELSACLIRYLLIGRKHWRPVYWFASCPYTRLAYIADSASYRLTLDNSYPCKASDLRLTVGR